MYQTEEKTIVQLEIKKKKLLTGQNKPAKSSNIRKMEYPSSLEKNDKNKLYL